MYVNFKKGYRIPRLLLDRVTSLASVINQWAMRTRLIRDPEIIPARLHLLILLFIISFCAVGLKMFSIMISLDQLAQRYLEDMQVTQVIQIQNLRHNNESSPKIDEDVRQF